MDEEIRRYIEVLGELVERSGKGKRDLERRMAWATGSLTKLLQGQWEIKLRQILEILKAIGVDPPVYYRLVNERRPITERLLQDLGSVPPAPVVLPPAMSEEELDRRIEEAVERALQLRSDRAEPAD